jgi:hypothetical protein
MADRPTDIELLVLILAGLFFMALATGCGSQTRGSSNLDRQEDITVLGSVTIPTATGGMAVPVNLAITRHVTEQAQSQKQTRLEAPELTAAIVGGLKQAFPALGAIIPSAPTAGWGATEIGLGGSTAALLAMLAKVMLELRAVKRDNDQVYDDLKRRALATAAPTSKDGVA